MAEYDDQKSLDKVLARFLDGDPEPSDGERLADAMRGDQEFAREVIRLLTVDDLLRQCAVPDDLAFLESFQLRLNGESGGDGFAGEFARRLRAGGSGTVQAGPGCPGRLRPRRVWRPSWRVGWPF